MVTQHSSDTPSRRIFIAPLFRFLTELTTWSWFLIATFTVHLIYVGGFLLSIGLLGSFNAQGDKRKEGPVVVPGYLRIGIEIFSGLLGIFAAWILFAEVGVLLQFSLTLFSFIIDYERWLWLLGVRPTPPESVSYLRG
jgi:hypothetical protein